MNTYLTTEGFYITTEIENGPSGVRNAWYYLYVIAPKSDTAYQILKPDTEANGNWYHRLMINNSWGAWKEITLQGWLNSYSNLPSLANALGVQSDYLGSGVTLQKGYGLLIISNISNGTSALFVVGAGTATKITDGNVYVTVTKQSEYVTVITPDNPSQSIRYMFISLA